MTSVNFSKRFLFFSFALIFLLTSAISWAQSTALRIEPAAKDCYVFITYHDYKGQRISANGLYVVTNAGVMMIDSPWDTTQFQPLLDSIWKRHHQHVVACIATHFHEDRTGGLAYYRQQGIRTYTTTKTDSLSKKRGMPRAEFLLKRDTVLKVGQYTFRTFFPGHGHAPDNIVVWVESQRLLYGGCLVKSVDDTTLGNLGDADVNAYAPTLRRVISTFPHPRVVITGHNQWRDVRSLEHTLKMAEAVGGK